MTILRFVLLGGISATMWGQAMVDYGLGVAAAGAAAAPGQAAGRALGGIFLNLQKTLNSTSEAAMTPSSAAAPAPAQTRRGARTAQPGAAVRRQANSEPAEPPQPAVVYEDPGGITVGMERAELLSRVGEPAMKITAAAGRESMTYQVKDRSIELELRDGKVASVQSKTRSRQPAVGILQSHRASRFRRADFSPSRTGCGSP
jgi:hypothetical protein